jgi:RNA polymerase sigma-70 factor (ECF subfamily)
MDATLLIGASAMSLEPEALYVVELVGFDDFYRREYPSLYAVASTMAGGMNAADDLVQDTMLRAFVNWRRVQGLEKPGGWCHRVLLNLCRKWYRRRLTEGRYLSRQRRVEPSSPEVSAFAVAFCDAARRLPSRPRAVVALYYLGDRSVSEVASILDVPEGTVRSDLSRARVVLSAELGL